MKYIVFILLFYCISFGGVLFSNACQINIDDLKNDVENSEHQKIENYIKNGCDLKVISDEYDLDLLNIAVNYDDMRMVKTLLANSFNVNRVNKFGNLCISWSISVKMADYLIEEGVNINYRSKDGLTPLHDLIMSSRRDIAKYIIKQGADINAVDNIGISPLMYAIKIEPLTFIEFLIKNGANVNIKSSDRTTALHRAILRNDIEIVKLLIDADADVNAQDIRKNTPLHQAAIDGRYEIVKLLIESGADVNIENSTGKTPLSAAMKLRPYPSRVRPDETDRQAVIDYLKASGGETMNLK